MALTNSAATLCGILAPYFSQTVAHSSDPTVLRGQWQTVFTVAALVHVAGAVIFAVFAKADEQPWAKDPTAASSQLDSEDPESNFYIKA